MLKLPFFVEINFKSLWGIFDFIKYLLNRILKPKYSAEVQESGLIIVNPKHTSLYHHGFFGKGFLSREGFKI
jgi:hypothetical protein